MMMFQLVKDFQWKKFDLCILMLNLAFIVIAQKEMTLNIPKCPRINSGKFE